MAGSVARDLDHSTRWYFHVEILFGGEEPATLLVRTPASGYGAASGGNSDGDSKNDDYLLVLVRVRVWYSL